MDFSFTPEQEQLRGLVRDFARREIAPHVAEWDRREEFPVHLIRRLGELDLLGLDFPEEVGGSAFGTVGYAILSDELAYYSTGFIASLLVHIGLGTKPLELFGTPEQQERYLRPALRGELTAAFALTEPGAGSDAARIETRATPDGDGWRLDGRKVFITNASFADYVVVAASTDPDQGAKGITLFLVERGTSGYTVSRRLRKMGIHLSDTTELVFDQCLVPQEAQLGPRGQGFVGLMKTLDHGRIGVAALALGTARAAFDQAFAYARERVAFGQPIGTFQVNQHRLADMATELELGRLLVYYAAWRAERGLPFVKEAAMAKVWTTEMAGRVVDQALQLHGGYGYVDEFPIERLYRDIRLFRIVEGTSEIQRNIIARQLER